MGDPGAGPSGSNKWARQKATSIDSLPPGAPHRVLGGRQRRFRATAVWAALKVALAGAPPQQQSAPRSPRAFRQALCWDKPPFTHTCTCFPLKT